MSCLQIIKCLRVDCRSGGCSSRQTTNPYHDATGKSQHTPFSAGDTALNPRLTPCLTRASESDGAQLCASRPPKGVCKGPAASLGVWDERVLLGMCGAHMHACSVQCPARAGGAAAAVGVALPSSWPMRRGRGTPEFLSEQNRGALSSRVSWAPAVLPRALDREREGTESQGSQGEVPLIKGDGCLALT